MKKIANFLILLCVFAGSLKGTIYEVQHFSQLREHVESNALILLDIDDTLLIPVQTLGTDVWFIHRMNQHKAMGMDPKNALEKALAEWEGIRHLTKIKLVEEGTDILVRQLQDNGIKVMGLTTQGLALATRTTQQLRSLGIDLSTSAPSKLDYYFLNGQGVLYRDGILFTSGTIKGKALMTLLKKIDYTPTKIVFINDKLTHLKDVEFSVEAEGIPFVGLRYAFSDARVASFDPKIADKQFAPFQSILSDEEASTTSVH